MFNNLLTKIINKEKKEKLREQSMIKQKYKTNWKQKYIKRKPSVIFKRTSNTNIA